MTAPHRRRPRRLNQEPASVRYAREKAGLSQAALAVAVGISPALMSEIESGWRSATPANLRLIADAVNCPVVWLEAKRDAEVVASDADPEPSAT